MAKKILVILFQVIAMVAFSQADTVKGTMLDEVVLTANKFPQKQSSTGKVVTVISKEQLEKNAGRSVQQVLNDIAGVSINGALSNMGTNPTVYMRGAQAGRTLILIDGIPVSDPSFIQNDFDLNLLNVNNIERIEIARGAQSTLYGSDAVAGVINIITQNKKMEKPITIHAMVSAGNYGIYRGSTSMYGKKGKLQYEAGYSKVTGQGFSAAKDTTNKKGFDNDGYDGDVANASFQYKLSTEFSLRGFGKYSRYKTDVDYGSFADDKDFTNTNSILLAGTGFQYSKPGITVTGLYQYTENRRQYFDDSTDVSAAAFSNFSKDDYFGKSQFIELYSNIQLGKNVSLLHGADYRYSSMNNQYLSSGYEAAFNDTSVSQSSAYASIFFHDNSAKLNIELGGRLNVHSQYGSNRTFTFNPSYRILPTLRVFGSIASGFKAPTLYQLFGGFVGNINLNPEKSMSHEIGVQHMHSLISSRITYFYRKIENGIDFDNAVTYAYFNFLQQTVKGIEVEERIEPVKNLLVLLNYTFLKPTEMTQNRMNAKDTTYSYLLRRPNHTANISVGYTYDNFYISLNGKYVGQRYDAIYGAADLMLKSFITVGAYAEYKYAQKWKIFISGENLTNANFTEVRGFNAIPFMFQGGIGVKL